MHLFRVFLDRKSAARACNSGDFSLLMPDYQTYRAKYHTSTSELAEIANRAKPGILVVYHTSGRGPSGRIPDEQLLREFSRAIAEEW